MAEPDTQEMPTLDMQIKPEQPVPATLTPTREYEKYLEGYLTKYRDEKKPFTVADLPTETEARTYWSAGRLDIEAQERLYTHSVRREETGFYYPDEKGVQVFVATPDGTTLPMGIVFYLPGQEKIALAEAKRRGIVG